MQFNGEANNLDLYSDALYWSGADSSQYTIEEFTRNANFALNDITSLILKSDTSWKWRDNTLSDELLDTTIDIVSGTANYAPLVTWLKIRRIRIKDTNGVLRTLKKVDREDLTDSQLRESGTPRFYYLLGGFIYLVSNPNYNSTNGLEVQFQKGADLFDKDDTTKQPGFASPYHRIVSLKGALDYVEANSIRNRAPQIRARIGVEPDYAEGIKGSGMLKAIVDFYSARDDDEQPRIKLEKDDYGARELGDIGGRTSSGNDLPRGFLF